MNRVVGVVGVGFPRLGGCVYTRPMGDVTAIQQRYLALSPHLDERARRVFADAEAEAAAQSTLSDENTVLEWLRRHPGITLRTIATNAGWVSFKGSPHTAKVHRLLKTLRQSKLVIQHRSKWQITDAGKKELEAK